LKVLITGHKGFIGQNFLEYANRLNWEVSTFDILDCATIRPSYLPIKGYDWVIHLGAISSTTETNIRKLMDINVSWSIELFEQCVSNGVNFQWASSASVYGLRHKEQGPFKLSDPCKPANMYAHSKRLVECYIGAREVDIVKQGFRYFNVYGPYEEHKKTQASPHSQFAKQAKETGIIRVFEGSEHFLRDFVSVHELIRFQMLTMKTQKSGLFNVGTGTPKSFLQVAEEVANKYKASIEVIPFPESLKNHYQTYTCAG
jgi:ADP-L-glycero-D-manno-heptose 6-epimerase